MGINGTDVTHKITPPLEVSSIEGNILTQLTFAVLPACLVPLMGSDLMSQLQIIIIFDKEGNL